MSTVHFSINATAPDLVAASNSSTMAAPDSGIVAGDKPLVWIDCEVGDGSDSGSGKWEMRC